MNIIDTHCHLDFPVLSDELESTLQHARLHQVTRFIVPAVNIENWSRVAQLAENHPEIAPAYGLHPLFTHQMEDVERLNDWLLNHSCVALGEFGLDFFDARSASEQSIQQHFFESQLDLAVRYQKPVILHVRKAHDAVLKALRRRNLSCAGVIHAFSGSEQQARQYIDLGFKLGFGGAITYERANKKRALLSALPLSAIVLETDAPDMPPSFLKPNEPNSPASAYGIAEIMAQHLTMPLDELIVQLNRNADAIFNLNVAY